jgi:hypothetical protein
VDGSLDESGLTPPRLRFRLPVAWCSRGPLRLYEAPGLVSSLLFAPAPPSLLSFSFSSSSSSSESKSWDVFMGDTEWSPFLRRAGSWWSSKRGSGDLLSFSLRMRSSRTAGELCALCFSIISSKLEVVILAVALVPTRRRRVRYRYYFTSIGSEATAVQGLREWQATIWML